MKAILLGACALLAHAAWAAQDWQTLSTPLAGSERSCEMRVPASWTLQDKGARFTGDYTATLIYEAEKPEVWWTKRKKVDLVDSRSFQDTKTNYWLEVQGALLSGGDEGSVHIAGVRDGDLVCHAVVEFKADNWRANYEAWQQQHAEMVRVLLTSLKPK